MTFQHCYDKKCFSLHKIHKIIKLKDKNGLNIFSLEESINHAHNVDLILFNFFKLKNLENSENH